MNPIIHQMLTNLHRLRGELADELRDMDNDRFAAIMTACAAGGFDGLPWADRVLIGMLAMSAAFDLLGDSIDA
ncbi:MAG: hypothetical protein GC159_17460 [Phycisphaera sp.]|nr:hypothetical protein [Phycisphaera sp.]